MVLARQVFLTLLMAAGLLAAANTSAGASVATAAFGQTIFTYDDGFNVTTGAVVSAPDAKGPIVSEGFDASNAASAGHVYDQSPNVVAPRTPQPGTAVQSYYSANNGFYGTPKATTLQPGATFNRYGSDFGRFTSPTGTPIHQRALPPGVEDGAYSAFRVVEPFTVQSGQVAPAFDSFGGGTQYLLPKSVKELLESGVIERVTP